jgi:hypothetical protein
MVQIHTAEEFAALQEALAQALSEATQQRQDASERQANQMLRTLSRASAALMGTD